MIWMALVYVVLLFTLLFKVKVYGKGKWNEDCFSLSQTKMMQGIMIIFILFHHLSQKSGAPWHENQYIVHGLDIFVQVGYFFVGVFLFCSGYGLYKSFHTKDNYLKGFFKRRVLPIIVAFYASEWIFLVIRVLLGEKMDVKKWIYYITGAQLANYYAWYAIALPIFYLFFYLAFRFCKKDGLAVFFTGVGIFLYTLLGTFIDHNDFWMKGEWWYNTAHLFFIGLVFAKFEKPIIAHIKKYYWIYFILLLVLIFVLYKFSMYATDTWSYYGENWGAKDKVLRRWGCLIAQMMSSCAFVFFTFILMMKVRFDNKILGFFGSITLEYYLIHGIFVELFGYNFLDVAKSLVYIKNVPLYVLVVVVCSVPATLLFKLLLKPINAKMK